MILFFHLVNHIDFKCMECEDGETVGDDDHSYEKDYASCRSASAFRLFA